MQQHDFHDKSKSSRRRFQPGCLRCRLRSAAELVAAVAAGGEIRACEISTADDAGLLTAVRVAFCPVEFNRPRVPVRLLEDDDCPELDGLDDWRERLAEAGGA